MRQRVLIGLCLPSGDLSGEIRDWIGRLMEMSENPDFPWEFEVDDVRRTSPVAYAENVLVGKFLAGSCDRILLVPEDCRPYPTTHRVLELDADVALSWTFIRTRTQQANTAWVEHNFFRAIDDQGYEFEPVPVDPETIPQAIDAGGMHCCAIRRRVFCPEMELPREWTDNVGRPRVLSPDDKGFAVPYFRTEYRPDGAVGRTDDFDFCWRAKKAGFAVAGHPLAWSGHVKTDDIGAFVSMAGVMLRRAGQ